MFHVQGSSKFFRSAQECAADHFGTEFVVFMPLLGIWFNGATGQCVTVVKE